MMKLVIIYALILLVSCKKTKPDDVETSALSNLQTADAVLEVVGGEGKYGISIKLNDGSTSYIQQEPLQVQVVPQNGQTYWKKAAYRSVEQVEGKLVAKGQLQTNNGSVLQFTDVYGQQSDCACFIATREVQVESAGAGDAGFSTRFAFQQAEASSLREYDFMVPSIWYGQNEHVPSYALASNLDDDYYWFREDRLPLPLVMLRKRNGGATFVVYHHHPDGATFKEEDGLNRIIDARMQFAALGLENKSQPLVGLTFPGSEGERTGVYGMLAAKRWAWRSHPLQEGFIQRYEVAFSLTKQADYPTALRNTWDTFYKLSNPTIYTVDLKEVYRQQLDVLNKYWKEINGTAGLPFRILLNGLVEAESDYNWDMGFVGQQLANASLMIREGGLNNNQMLLEKGEKMVDFWATHSLSTIGIPRTWYDPIPQSWRTEATHMRVIGDGMNGLLWAWNFRKKQGIDKAEWLSFAGKVADWLLSIQNSDGSFFQQYNYETGAMVNSTKNNTSNVIPFLVDLYLITGNIAYRDAALKAGQFIYTNIHEPFHYAGGAADNPNVPDKESVSMALRAFLALHDVNKEERWLTAALQAAYYYQTWVYAWNVPIPIDDSHAVFPASRSVTGTSAIATANNAADTYAAIDAFNYFRLYLYTHDTQLLNQARLLLKNTKQFMNWNPADPISAISPGLLGEAFTVIIPRGHGVNYFLPWQTFNLLEPMVLLQDVFGNMDIDELEKQSESQLEQANREYASSRGFKTGTIIHRKVD